MLFNRMRTLETRVAGMPGRFSPNLSMQVLFPGWFANLGLSAVRVCAQSTRGPKPEDRPRAFKTTTATP